MSDELIKIKIVSYEEQFQAIQNIRIEVFQIEQGVASELEFDGLDAAATHLIAYVDGNPVGTLRIREIEPKIVKPSIDEISPLSVKIERLAVLTPFRSRGIGKKLMLMALVNLKASGDRLVVVHAQEYIKKLYQQLGFEQVGAKFEEAGISHVKMTKQL